MDSHGPPNMHGLPKDNCLVLPNKLLNEGPTLLCPIGIMEGIVRPRHLQRDITTVGTQGSLQHPSRNLFGGISLLTCSGMLMQRNHLELSVYVVPVEPAW